MWFSGFEPRGQRLLCSKLCDPSHKYADGVTEKRGAPRFYFSICFWNHGPVIQLKLSGVHDNRGKGTSSSMFETCCSSGCRFWRASQICPLGCLLTLELCRDGGRKKKYRKYEWIEAAGRGKAGESSEVTGWVDGSQGWERSAKLRWYAGKVRTAKVRP